MSFFDDASLAFLPSGGAGKDGKAYSIKPTDGTGDFTFSRGSNLAATRVNASGLIEKGRENLLKQSNNFDTSPWSVGQNTVTGGQAGYDGTNDAWLIDKQNTSGTYMTQSISQTGVHTISLYAKAGSLKNILFFVSGGDVEEASFLLEGDGSVTRTLNTPSASIQRVGTSDWYRCKMVVVDTSQVRIYPASSSSSVSGTLGNIYIQDAQLEVGLAATDYIESGATTGKAGLLEDEPRFDYSGGASCPSLLLEPSRTNLATYSELFGSSYYLNAADVDVTYTPNYGISPEGVKNSTRVQYANNTAFSYRAVTLSADNTASLYVKGTSGEKVRFGFGTTVDQGGVIHTFDGTWQRIVHTASTGAQLYLSSYTDDNQALDFEIYGLQHEVGSYVTSYIPNHSGGSVTRGVDDISKLTGVGVTGDEFSIFLEFDLSDAPLVSNDGTFLRTEDSSGNSQQEFRFFNSNAEQVFIPYFRQDTSYAFGTGIDANRFDGKVLFRADGGGSYTMFFGFNGSSNKEVRTGLTAYTLNKIDFTSVPKTNLKQLLIFNEALSDADCTTLTT